MSAVFMFLCRQQKKKKKTQQPTAYYWLRVTYI